MEWYKWLVLIVVGIPFTAIGVLIIAAVLADVFESMFGVSFSDRIEKRRHKNCPVRPFGTWSKSLGRQSGAIMVCRNHNKQWNI